MTALFRTLTPEECDRLIQRARIRRAERAVRGSWIRYHLQWQLNNSWPAHSAQPASGSVLSDQILGAQAVGR